MALFGQLGEFSLEQEEWPQYVERLEHFLCANGIDSEERKRAIFLSIIGPTTYKLLCSLISPSKPGDKPLTDLIDTLKSHYSPKPSTIVQRFKFHMQTRQAGESVGMFLAELRAVAQHCNFGPTLDDMLQDRLVCGINDGSIQRLLLYKVELTLEDALKIALSYESAARNARELQVSVMGKVEQPMQGAEQVQAVTQAKAQQQRVANSSCY